MGRRKRKHRLVLSGKYTAVCSLVTGRERTCIDTACSISHQCAQSSAAFPSGTSGGSQAWGGQGGRAVLLHMLPAVRREEQVYWVVLHLTLLFQVRTQKLADFSWSFWKERHTKARSGFPSTLEYSLGWTSGPGLRSKFVLFYCISGQLQTSREALGVSLRKGSSTQTHWD